jgi:fructokinase
LVKIGEDDAALVADGTLDEWQEALLASGAGGVLATRGSDGASLTLAGREPLRQGIAALDGDVVDTMGAGDATFASVVSSLLAQTAEPGSVDWETALTDAMRVAAATVRAPGALLRRP